MVLGIGLSKTGTTSLNSALQILGWDSKHDPAELLRFDEGSGDGRLRIDLEAAARHPALTDLPIARFFKELDAAIPGIKFIATTRAPEPWLKSVSNHIYKPSPFAVERELHRQMYGSDTFDRELYSQAYARHYSAVEEYFADRPADILFLDVSDENKWERLCSFLGLPVPTIPYPSENTANQAPPWLKKAVRSNPVLLHSARRLRQAYRDARG